jgi:ISXO2 transposase-like protein/transposase-like zinc ribbon protein
MAAEPTTLQEAIVYFSQPENCLNYVVSRRWPDGVKCPHCGSSDVAFLSRYLRWQCKSKHPRRQFTAKVGTIFEDSPLGLDKWLCAIWLVVNCKNGVSSYEIHRDLKVTQKTAWFIDHRIRLALQAGTLEKIDGEVEVDETYIGGKARNMHFKKRQRLGLTQKASMIGKVAVMGLLERHSSNKGHSTMRLQVVEGRKRRHFDPVIDQHIEKGATINTDAHPSYSELAKQYTHNVIDHAEKYVDGNIHTNGCENFWSLLKRSIKGTYVSVEPFHLFRYLDEQCFRFNNRAASDAERFHEAVSGITGKRLMYRALIGKATAEA